MRALLSFLLSPLLFARVAGLIARLIAPAVRIVPAPYLPAFLKLTAADFRGDPAPTSAVGVYTAEDANFIAAEIRGIVGVLLTTYAVPITNDEVARLLDAVADRIPSPEASVA